MIKGGKIFLKLMRTEDIPKSCKLLKSDSAKMLCENFGQEINIEDRTAEIMNIVQGNEKNRFHFLAYTSRKKKLIGYVFVSGINWIRGSGELVVIVDEQYIGMGYGTLISIIMMNYCFNELNFNKVSAKIRVDNKNIPERVEGQLNREIYSVDSKTNKEHITSYYYKEWLKDEWYKDNSIRKICNIDEIG